MRNMIKFDDEKKDTAANERRQEERGYVRGK